MKRLAAGLIALLLAFTLAAAAAEDASRLVVGNPTPMRGEFFTDMWGNATSDADVRDLLHGYNLIMWDGSYRMFSADPSVVSAVAAKQDSKGNHTYEITLCDDLYYSDGSKITAWDYAFSYLFSIAPELKDIGATPLRREQIVGYADYIENGGVLAGVRILSDSVISVTLDHEYLPFFYEMGLLSCNPYPIAVIAPGVVVRDDGKGVYLANEDPEIVEPIFTAELLRETVLNPETGYLSHPVVVSGPYTLTAWDGVTAEFAINPYYKGNTEGYRPTIPTLTYTTAVNDTMVDQIVEGEFGLLNKTMRVDRVLEAMDRMSEASLEMTKYPRIGLSYISFACERATVSSQAVRQAIAWCFDRDGTVSDYVGSFGVRVDGFYGIGQWMYELITGVREPPVQKPADETDTDAMTAYEDALADYAALNLNGLTAYHVDTTRAAQLLEEDGWLLNDDGLREKDGVTLQLTLIYPVGNRINEILEERLLPNLEAVGIALEMQAVPMVELLSMWYKQEERSADLIYLATNFDLVFDPSVHFQTSEEGVHNWAYTNLEDEALFEAAVTLRKTQPGDVLTYMQRWVAFQERFNEVLPMLPVYSNYYFDFYTNRLKNYDIEEAVTWGEAIVSASLEAPAGDE